MRDDKNWVGHKFKYTMKVGQDLKKKKKKISVRDCVSVPCPLGSVWWEGETEREGSGGKEVEGDMKSTVWLKGREGEKRWRETPLIDASSLYYWTLIRLFYLPKKITNKF